MVRVIARSGRQFAIQVFALVVALPVCIAAQTLSREYIRVGGRVVAVENASAGVVSAPQFSPAAGTFNTSQSITITSGTSGASIRYTTNGTTPTSTTGTLYSGAFSLSSTTTLKAIAYKTGMTDSTVTTGVYTFTETVSQPNPPSGPSSIAQSSSATYSTGGSVSSFGSQVQYLFDWGDGTQSGWLATGVTSASHAWTSTGTKVIYVQGRSATNPSIVSSNSTPVSVTVTTPFWGTLYLDRSSYYTGQGFTVTLSSNRYNTNFRFCWSFNSSTWCQDNYAHTDNNGNWYGQGNFQPGQEGYWSEWVEFLDGTSNTASFYVSQPYAYLYIYPSSLHYNDSWSLTLSTNIPNTTFTLCAQTPQVYSCTPNWGQTDYYGNWYSSGSIPPGTATGQWVEWVEIPGVITSSYAYFTVNP